MVKMSSSVTVEHSGVIKSINNNLVSVSIMQQSACGNCKARSACSLSDDSEKVIDVSLSSGDNYRVGEEIKVVLRQSLGMKALGYGYILPFLVLFTTLVLLVSLGVNEGLAGLLALSSLVPYYLGLSFFRDRLKKEFSFSLKKLRQYE
jgi:sigma-E factor negative regulatory protein RseC